MEMSETVQCHRCETAFEVPRATVNGRYWCGLTCFNESLAAEPFLVSQVMASGFAVVNPEWSRTQGLKPNPTKEGE